jgi:ADP-heptose:LPS heptosyltransferase
MPFLKSINSTNLKTKSGISKFRLRTLKILDATVGYWLCWILGYVDYQRNPQKQQPGGSPKNILVVRPGGMGDMILLVPVLKRLLEQFPSAQIDIICEKRNIEALRLAGFKKNAFAYDAGMLRIIRMLRSRSYDIAIDTEQFHNFSAIITFLSCAPVRIGFKINPQRNLLYTHLVSYNLDGYEGDQFAKLLEPAGIKNFSYKLEGSLPASGTILLPPIQEKLNGLQKTGKVVTIHPGSTSRYKQWDIAKFISLIRALISKHGCSVALIGSCSDADQTETILKNTLDLKEKIASLVDNLTLQETAELLRQSSLFVSGDSGLSHLAIAVGTPTVVIFGPTDPAKWGLHDSRHGIARKNLACSPCFIFGYHKLCRSVECMAGISAEEVLALCDDLLKSG